MMKARQMLLNMLKWREEMGVDAIAKVIWLSLCHCVGVPVSFLVLFFS